MFATSAFFFLWLFVFSVPWEGILLVPGFGTAARVIGFVAFGVGAVGILERGYIRSPGPGLLLMVLFVTWSSATYFWSINQQASMVRISTYSQLLVAAFLISQFCSSRKRLRWMIQAYILGACVSSVDILINYYLQRGTADERYSATGLNANDVGLIIALSLPFSYQLAVETPGIRSWLYRLHVVVAITAILLTASRSAMVASLVALGIVPTTGLLRRSRRAFVATLVTGAIASCAVWFVVPQASWQRLGTTTAEMTEGTLDSRTTVWAAGLKVFPLHPFLGVGSGAYEDSVTPIIGYPDSGQHFVAHNTYLSILVECGLVGLLIVVLLVLVLARHVAALPSARAIMWTFCLLTLATAMTSATWENYKPAWILLSLCFSLRAPGRCGRFRVTSPR